VFRKLADTYVYGNVHIALAAVSLTLFTRDILQLPMRTPFVLFVFCGTLFFYTVQRLLGMLTEKNIHAVFRRHYWNSEHRRLLFVIALISGAATAWMYFDLLLISQVLAVIPGLLSLTYALRIIPTGKGWIRPREIPGVKVFIVALVWGITGALIPAAAGGKTGLAWSSGPVLLWFAGVTAMIFALTVPFDIRDLNYDGKRLRTFPALLGIRGAIALSVFVLALFPICAILIRQYYGIVTPTGIVTIIAWSILSAIVIVGSTPKRHEFYYSFLIDGLIVLLWPLLLLVNCVQGFLES